MPEFKDVSHLPEDERIDLIGQKAMELDGKSVGFAVDDRPRTINRYIRKLQQRFPFLTVKTIGVITKGSFALRCYKTPQG